MMTIDFTQEWVKYLSKISKVVVFDTETSGINEGQNVILSISWQELDGKLNKVIEKTYYFDWPDDEGRVSQKAIDVNGLTRERLASLGTSPKAAVLRVFSQVLCDADLIVAHNGNFDMRFVMADAKEAGVEIGSWRDRLWDIMVRMTDYCKIPGLHDGFKLPKLIELAEKLGVEVDDIDWHQSASDVEVTTRCFREIAKRGIVKP